MRQVSFTEKQEITITKKSVCGGHGTLPWGSVSLSQECSCLVGKAFRAVEALGKKPPCTLLVLCGPQRERLHQLRAQTVKESQNEGEASTSTFPSWENVSSGRLG